MTNIRNNVKIELIAHKKLTAVIGCQLFAWNLANDSNFDRNRVRGCNFGSEGGAFLILGGVQFFAEGRGAPSGNNALRENNFLLKCVCFSPHPLQTRKKRGII